MTVCPFEHADNIVTNDSIVFPYIFRTAYLEGTIKPPKFSFMILEGEEVSLQLVCH